MSQVPKTAPARVPLDVLSDTIQPFLTFSEIYVEAPKKLSAGVATASGPIAADPPMAM